MLLDVVEHHAAPVAELAPFAEDLGDGIGGLLVSDFLWH
jgi:hypothetical protein